MTLFRISWLVLSLTPFIIAFGQNWCMWFYECKSITPEVAIMPKLEEGEVSLIMSLLSTRKLFVDFSYLVRLRRNDKNLQFYSLSRRYFDMRLVSEQGLSAKVVSAKYNKVFFLTEIQMYFLQQHSTIIYSKYFTTTGLFHIEFVNSPKVWSDIGYTAYLRKRRYDYSNLDDYEKRFIEGLFPNWWAKRCKI